MKKLNYLFLTICMLAIGTWSHAQCTGSGGFLANQGASALCEGDTTNIVLAVANAPAQGDVSGYSWVITNADISMSTDPTNSATLVAALPITDMPAVTLAEVLSDYVSDAGTYYLTSVAFGNGTWTGMDMETIADVTLDPDCTFSSASTELEFGGADCPPSNDACSSAIDLSSGLGQGIGNMITSGPYDNTTATVNANELEDGLDTCFGEPGFGAPVILNNPVWFKITGDGNHYSIRASVNECVGDVSDPIEDNDTQIAIYTGGCNGLSLVACNEDAPFATAGDYFSDVLLQTEAGTEYFILVDGFDCSDPSACGGVVSTGEFCMSITQAVLCDDPLVGVGEATVLNNVLCQPDDSLAVFFMSEALAPAEGDFYGYIWLLSSEDLAGSTDPLNQPSVLGSFGITDRLIDTLIFDLPSNGFGPDAYFLTLCTFGNATASNGQLVLDPNCTFVSNSAEVNYYEATEEICVVGVPEVDEAVLGMTVFPNPVEQVINLNINTAEYKEAVIMVTNVMGQTIHQQAANLQSGANTFSIELDNVPAGVYMISVETDSHQSVSRFLKQ